MGGFRELDLRIAYTSADEPLESFYIPVLSQAVRYDRAAGFFSSGALVVAAQGLAHLIRAGGTMRLAVGAKLTEDDVEAIRSGEAGIEEVTTERIVRLLEEPEDGLAHKRLEALAWMVAAGSLQVKVVLPRGPDGHPLPAPDAEAYFHVKWGILTDASGDRVAFSGSINETMAAWRHHFEDIAVFRSWTEGDGPHHVERLARHFETIWHNRASDWIALPVPEAVKSRLLSYRPDEAPEADPLEQKPPKPPPQAMLAEERAVAAFLLDASYLLGSGERLGRQSAGIRPWPHQLRVAEAVVGTFPERYLLADEVGLGKTIEVGLVLRDLVVSGVVKRALVLAPASVLQQWQDELREKLALDVEIFDGTRFVGPPPYRTERDPKASNPFDDAGLLLCSSQLVKRKDRRTQLLSASDWDLVVVDEAHHARRKDFLDLRARRPNRLLELLEGPEGLPGLSSKTRGLLLLSATPMQVHPVEVWDLLVQLGIPGRWGASETAFLRYFSELERAKSCPEKADWGFLARLASDELKHGGPLDPKVERVFENTLGFAAWARIRGLVENPESAPREAPHLSHESREALVTLLRHLTPLRRRMFRHTRDVLKSYEQKGMLAEKVPERDPKPRWIKMTDEEAELYERVEEYISDFYHIYERERKGLGFVMAVYRRRLTSSFAALEQSLRRRLEHLKGLRPDPGLTDEDTEDAELSEDVSEATEVESQLNLRRIHKEEIEYVDDFLNQVRKLGSDSKFEQLVEDLASALSRRDQVVVFTQYTDTMDYLKQRLQPIYGRGIACFSGRGGEWWNGLCWSYATKEEIKTAFKAGDIKILLGTDALAEGLNLQTCGVEINYDAPWNPMRLEQRIGRIDRIGQRHDRIWIWTYFYEDTVEAEVYRRLGQRIGWFEGIVGPLQPILHRVERTIRELALATPKQRHQAMSKALDELEQEIAGAQSGGFDLDAYLDKDVDPPQHTAPPATLEDLEEFLTASATVGHRFSAHPQFAKAYILRIRGQSMAVTFDPEVADAHPDSLRLLTFGDPRVNQLLAEAAKGRASTGKLLRIATEDSPRRFVAWYGMRDGEQHRIERLADLLACLKEPPPSEANWEDKAQKDFSAAVEKKLNTEREALCKQVNERISALEEQALRILARATYIWAAQLASSGHSVGRLSKTTVESMIKEIGYPFAPLAQVVGELPEVGDNTAEWQEVEQNAPKKLDGLWQAVRAQSERLLGAICEAKQRLSALEVPPSPPKVTVSAH